METDHDLHMQTNRHAYLIMCHCNFNQLIRLLQLLDDKRNDIYLHIDKKSKEVPLCKIIDAVKQSSLIFIRRMRVNWGGYSQIKVELELLKEAAKSNYAYYHLISGADLPLKSQDDIHDYFADNKAEYISVSSTEKEENRPENYLNRLKYYNLFQDVIGRNKGIRFHTLNVLNICLLRFQRLIGIDRTRKSQLIYYKGSNWFSVTHEMAKYILSQEKLIRKYFKYTVCADEHFLQTIAMSSQLKDHISGTDMRYIDWKRGTPYVFRDSDFQELIDSGCLFARKFDETIDNRIVGIIYEYCKTN